MPRPRRPGAPEPKRRSRKGCWPCKARKVKCGEEKPTCLNCQRQGETCDYSIRLNWGGRTKRASVSSPDSQSKGYGDNGLGLADPMTPSTVSSGQLPPSDVSDKAVSGYSGSLASPAAVSPGTPFPPGHFDSPKPLLGPDGVASPSQLEIQFSSWAQPSPPITTPATSDPLPHYPFSQKTFDSVSYTAPVAQGLGIRSLSAFPFHTTSVSQPVSFLRHSVDSSNQQSDSPSQDHDGQFIRGSHDGHGTSMSMTGLTEESTRHHSAGSGVSSLLGPSDISTQETDSSPSRRGGTPTTMGPARAFSKNDREPTVDNLSTDQSRWQAYLTSVTDNYGLDCGRPDLDLSRNNDHAAIDINYALDLISSRWRNEDVAKSTAPPPKTDLKTPDCTGYYASPVPINIPRYLAPLPSTLLENPINLMYFHHFLNHTSRMLVPHDCDDNPFMSVLPSMAVSDPNLLNLLLAYSASHRGRYLGHPEPANRIAHWVSNVFPTLRMALEASHEDITDGHLATAIMLLSLKIVSPGTFEVPVTWQSHLKLARDLFLARAERMAHRGNSIGAFFARWLGYIDTMGALSCRQAGPPLTLYHSILKACSTADNHDEFCADCFTGFTPRTGVFLIRLARLVQQCDNERFDEMGNFRQGWHPSADMVMEAQAVLGDIDGLSEHAHANPHHHQGVESLDMMATEEAFRYAGLLHLHRRILGSSPDSFAVKDALRKLIDALGRMRPDASTEVCSLFPLFTAGCESRDLTHRTKLLDRFFVLEKTGLKQIQNARQLMQRCWNEKLPWVALAEGQFLG